MVDNNSFSVPGIPWATEGRGRIFRRVPFLFVLLCMLVLAACRDGQPWNSPYPSAEAGRNILYSSFAQRPKHLDPARAYSANEYTFIGQVYEPPLQYHYLDRPYRLVPLTAERLPVARYLDADRRILPDDAEAGRIAYTVYEVRIRPGILYAPHPAFARTEDGALRYADIDEDWLDGHGIETLADFPEVGTREVTAADYVHGIRRLADPDVMSPIFGLMSEYIVGLRELGEAMRRARADGLPVDIDALPFDGAEAVDRYTYRILVRGRYPQLLYWLAMPFFAPMPPEADRFYARPGMAERNLSLDWYPVGSGPYRLVVNDPNRRMVLERNPVFHGETYPSSGEAGDRARGLLDDAGRPLPFIDRVVYSLEKETIPYWNKFLQGYYDASGVGSDSFDQAIRIGAGGEIGLSDALRAKGIRLQTAVNASIFYLGFNMLDPVVGGYTERQRKLRRAISIAMDYEEFISIFSNGRGIAAQGPLPPGIFGYRSGRAGINPYVYDWRDGRPRRKSIAEARRLLAEAGYPDGVDRRTGRPLVLHLDITAGGPDDKARLDWYRKQLQKIDLQLVIRNTDYNRFQDKMRNGNAQLFVWGWNADYPDPENFLFLLYGPNGKARFHGENAANYASPRFDALFERMKTMDNGPERQAIIDEMVDLLRRDAPWIWGLHPKSFVLYHGWYANAKPNLMANNTLKYLRIDPLRREAARREWNRPVVWPLAAMAVALGLFMVPAVVAHHRREWARPRRTSNGGGR